MKNAEYEKRVDAMRAYFDGIAPTWREDGAPDDAEIKKLLSVIPLKSGCDVLDVACGAGILDGCLLEAGLKVDAVDLSEKMIEKAKLNPKNRAVNYYACDFNRFDAGKKYDFILVFDSYPHFADKRLFCRTADGLLKADGMLWIFFDQSKEAINSRHGTVAKGVSTPLNSAEKEAEIFENSFETVFLRDDSLYYLGLRKKIRQIFS